MTDWQRIESLGISCPICGKPDWCLLGEGVAICGRVERCDLPTCQHCQQGRSRTAGEAGYLHFTTAQQRARRRRVHRVREVHSDYFTTEHRRCLAAIQPGQVDWLAQHLHVAPAALRRFELGWHCRGFTVPIFTTDHVICGLHIRRVNGTKSCLPGSALSVGLFVPQQLTYQQPLYICEGFSDAAAALTLGLEAIARVSVTCSRDLVRRFVVSHTVPTAIITVDRDADGRGEQASRKLASYLSCFRCNVGLLQPPTKDLRSWVTAGATPQALEGAIEHVKRSR